MVNWPPINANRGVMTAHKARHRATDRPVADYEGRIGYARVSTGGQSVQRQVDELRKAGCAEILEETASGDVLTGRHPDQDRTETAANRATSAVRLWPEASALSA